MKILEALLRLRQAACHLGMLPGQERKGSSKINLLLSGLEKCLAGGHKALIFSQWTSLLIQATDCSMKYLRITAASKRQDIVKQFQTSDEYISFFKFKAAGIGLNFSAADHVFIMDPWWNPAVDQAADRSYRIGQKPVIVHKL